MPGVSKTQGPDPGIPAWKFRRRVPVLTLPWDYSVYLLSTVQAALGFHFVARQNPGSEGTLISLASPAASKRDGQPLLQLASSTQDDQLRLAYRAVHNMEPASLVFPGSTPFAHSRWAQLALNLEPRRISLYVDCQEPFIFENRRGEDLLSLLLPLDLQITFASLAGDESSKFLVSPAKGQLAVSCIQNVPKPTLVLNPEPQSSVNLTRPVGVPSCHGQGLLNASFLSVVWAEFIHFYNCVRNKR